MYILPSFFMILTYRIPFQSSIKNNKLFTSLEKNKQLYNQLLEIVGTANSIQGSKEYNWELLCVFFEKIKSHYNLKPAWRRGSARGS